MSFFKARAVKSDKSGRNRFPGENKLYSTLSQRVLSSSFGTGAQLWSTRLRCSSITRHSAGNRSESKSISDVAMLFRDLEIVGAGISLGVHSQKNFHFLFRGRQLRIAFAREFHALLKH